MVKGTFASACKIILFIVNIVFWVLGVAILGVGIYSEIQRQSNVQITIIGSTGAYAAVAMILVGVLVFIIGFSGCCGAAKEHRGLLILYGVLVLLVFILQIAAGIFGFVERHQVEDTVVNGMTNTLNDYDPLQQDLGDTKAWDTVQMEVKCCGVRNYSSWDNASTWTSYTKDTDGIYPGSCCANPYNETVSGFNVSTCTVAPVNMLYTVGCYDEILSNLEQYWKVLAGVGVGVAVFQLMVILMACVLQHAIKKAEYTAV